MKSICKSGAELRPKTQQNLLANDSTNIDARNVTDEACVEDNLGPYEFFQAKLQAIRSANNMLHLTNEKPQNEKKHLNDDKFKHLSVLSYCYPDTKSSIASVVQYSAEKLNKMLQDTRKLFELDGELKTAYAAHCQQATKAKQAEAQHNRFDKYTTMDYAKLEATKKELQEKYMQTRGNCVNLNTKLGSTQRLFESKYQLLLTEDRQFERYQLEAIEARVQIKFGLDKRRIAATYMKP
ncbi:uncharacterized protein LOC115629195 [Scaptodrosophila lebanonensis]|uniref:Uncharacterized protein LOC115629195 n=1 Tax=Drosophila lebanonensis TaxID=7225 RepID=A0A6J2TZC7_DROLE|nr:uncharacterized protein LOC115629195 [Scaptodrosophila lebanonensis]